MGPNLPRAHYGPKLGPPWAKMGNTYICIAKTSQHKNVYIYLCIYIHISVWPCRVSLVRTARSNIATLRTPRSTRQLFAAEWSWRSPSKLGYHGAQIGPPVDLLAFQTTTININTNNRFLLPRGGLTVLVFYSKLY